MTFQNAKIVSENVNPSEYHSFGASKVERGNPSFIMSRSGLMEFAACPHRWKAGIESGDTKSTEWGSLIDCLALTGLRFGKQYSIVPETYTITQMQCPYCGGITDSQMCKKCNIPRVAIKVKKPWNRNSEYCAYWESEQVGRTLIKSEVYNLAQKAMRSILENKNVSELIGCSSKSVMLTAEYRDSETGLVIPLKCLLDLVPDKSHPRFGKCLSDFKTAADASPREFEKAIFRHHYDAQAALYTDIYTAATNEDRVEWIFALQENIEPFEVADPLPALSSEFMDVGRAKYQHALKFYARCLKEDKWPSYSPGARESWDGRYFSEPEPWMLAAAVEWPRLPDTLPIIQPIKTQLAEVTP